MTSDHEFKNHLTESVAGDDSAFARLLPEVHDDLRQIAVAHFARERADHTLQPTALVNEMYLRLSQQLGPTIQNRQHFFAIASRLMRQILVDHARGKNTEKRGGNCARISLSEAIGSTRKPEIDVLVLDEALDKLAGLNPSYARLVELRFFGGMSSEEAGEILGISRAEVARQWRITKTWLMDELREMPKS